MSTPEPTLADDLASAYAERDHWQRAAVGAEEVSAKTEAENAALRAELEALRTRTARLIAAEVASDPRDPPVATCDCAERMGAAERRLTHARRMCHVLLDDIIDGRRR